MEEAERSVRRRDTEAARTCWSVCVRACAQLAGTPWCALVFACVYFLACSVSS